ncbi:MAG: M23 family metallopeptidase [Candidatus Zixiibacteriota bacterium]
MAKGKYYNLMIVPDGVESPLGIRLPSWLFKSLLAFAVIIIVGLILFFAFYGNILSRAVEANRLEKENEQLEMYKLKVGLLEEHMKETRAIVKKISGLVGVDIDIPELPSDSVLFASLDSSQIPAIMTRSVSALPGCPDGLPLQGYMTRGFIDDEDEYHPGVDIAAAVGTPVLATASGKVAFAGEDSTYGLMIILDHDDSISTVYGHNSELLVEKGNDVLVGGRIALSGNTGISSAPHLHYEIRENNIPVNPLKYISEDDEESN